VEKGVEMGGILVNNPRPTKHDPDEMCRVVWVVSRVMCIKKTTQSPPVYLQGED